jgi:hypothetical protein
VGVVFHLGTGDSAICRIGANGKCEEMVGYRWGEPRERSGKVEPIDKARNATKQDRTVSKSRQEEWESERTFFNKYSSSASVMNSSMYHALGGKPCILCASIVPLPPPLLGGIGRVDSSFNYLGSKRVDKSAREEGFT